MKDIWMVTAGFVLGWLLSKTWDDPSCRAGMIIWVVVTAVMALAFALAVVGHGRQPDPRPEDDDDE